MNFIGLSGTGKTTCSLVKSWQLNKPLIDTDTVYEKLYKNTTHYIIKHKKDQKFRKIEEKINNLITHTKYTISIGGGVIINYTTLKYHLTQTKTILLTHSRTQNKPIYKTIHINKLKLEREQEFKFRTRYIFQNV